LKMKLVSAQCVALLGGIKPKRYYMHLVEKNQVLH